jgi:hypothetical protein
MQNVSGQAGRPNYGSFQQNGQPNQGGAVSQQYARANTSMPQASAAAPRQAAPVRTVSAAGGGSRSFGGGGHR